jgi:hypothetical protein
MSGSWRLAGAATEAHQIEENEALAAIASGSQNWAVTQVAIGNSATLLCPSRAGRRSVTLTNRGVTAIYFGSDNKVSVASGVPLPGIVGASKTIGTSAEIWGITADAANVSIEELFNRSE